ncbi:4-coumarate--CoA ligase-like 7 [Contarinia nasturtii]|uniref:4-coumarate--CoA ligase-like 7 n=1 Tax=Contarinia nasturtii TaxID=265458 RepID=UPI0012D3FF48|nr:4-coumarate--CoA ligase-like 7 [Contarinia nasturtii]
MFSTKYDEETKVWRGHDEVPMYNPKVSLAQVLLTTMKNMGQKVAQISDDNGVELTFEEIRLKTIRGAQNLQNLGYEPKQVFSLMAKNSHHVAPIVFASISIGCSVNTLDPTFGKIELIHMLNTTKPCLVFCDDDNYDLVSECLTELKNDAKVFTFGNDTKDGAESVDSLFSETNIEDDFIPVRVDGETEAATIICSSGTTGLSKGVCQSHAALLDSINMFGLSNISDIMLCFSSLYWLSGLMVLLKGTICGATRIITTEPYSPELQLRLMEKYKVTYAMNAPHHLTLMMKNEQFTNTDLSTLKYQFVGGSKCPLHVKTEMNSYLPNGKVYSGYGMSEVSGVISCDFPGSIEKDCVGKLSNGYEVKIIDDQGEKCEPNVDGEICLKTNYKFLGYYANDKATEELFDDDGYMMTGDIGHFDDDGDLFIVDRKKDLLKFCNMQISPSQVESYIIESPEIKSVCVIGIPDDENGDLPAAVVVRADGSDVSGEDIYNMVAEHFSDHFKLRGGVYFVDSLPTTPSGKVLRRKVKESTIELYNIHKE